MKYRQNLLSPGHLAVIGSLMSALSSPAALAQVAPPAGALVSARVDDLLTHAEAVRALPANVLCRNEALQTGGHWLLVSRS